MSFMQSINIWFFLQIAPSEVIDKHLYIKVWGKKFIKDIIQQLCTIIEEQ